MDYKNLIPAPIDDKNITTDWIEEIFDFDCAASNGKTYLGFINGLPIKADIKDHQIYWSLLSSHVCFESPSEEEVKDMIAERNKRLRYLDDNKRIHVDYRYMHGGTTLVQSFYWSNND